MSFIRPPARRSRRRLVWIAGLAILPVVLMAVALQFRTERRRVDSYLRVTGEVTAAYDDVATSVRLLMRGLEGSDRPAILDDLQEALTAAAAATDLLEGSEVPRATGVANGFLVVATRAWRDGISVLDDGIATVLDDPSDPSGPALLDAAFLKLRLGDDAFRGFEDSVASLAEKHDVPLLAVVRFVPPGTELLFDTDQLTLRLENLKALSARHDLAVADIRLDPSLVAPNEEGIPVLPPSDAVIVEVTISNRGNEAESGIPVSFSLLSADGSTVPITKTMVIEHIGPGELATLTFVDIAIGEGGVYEVVVEVLLDDDAEPASNRDSRVFLQSPAE